MEKRLTKEQIQKELSEMNDYVPVSKIEERLGMPPTTLQKVLSGKRELPKKWYKVLEAYFVQKPEKKDEADNENKETIDPPKPKDLLVTKVNEPKKGEYNPFSNPFFASKNKIKRGCKNGNCFCTGACQEIVGYRDPLYPGER